MLATAQGLLAAAMPLIEQRGLTLVGVAVANLDHGQVVQPELPFDAASHGGLDTALDAVRRRYGSSAVTRAAMLGRDPGLPVPQLPD